MNRINLICLGVKDLAQSLKFYKGLGFKTYEKAANPPIVFFDTQGTKFELFPLDDLARDINADNPPVVSPTQFNGITLAINGKSREEVDEVMTKAASLGARIVKPATQNPDWDGYSGYFQDLDGYYWEAAYGGMWQFDDNDMLIIPKDI